MRVSYVTIEDIFSGLFETQVKNPLIAIAEKNPHVRLKIYAINYCWNYIGKKNKIKKLKDKFSEKDIELKIVPLLIPVKFTMLNIVYCKLFLAYMSFLISFLPRSEIMHCRGYFTAIAAVKAHRQEKIVFDMRSLWILENIAAGTLTSQSTLEKFWLKLEKAAITQSEAVVGVSESMGAHVADLGGNNKYWTVPISVDLAAVRYCENARNRLRFKYGWSDNDVVAVYSGSFGLAGVNRRALVDLMTVLNKSELQLKILILSNENKLSASMLCTDAGIGLNKVVIVSLKPSELGPYLSAADFGFHALPVQPDSNTRLGTKTIEYWANGLPVVLSSTVGAAADICRKHDLGTVVDLDAINSIKLKDIPKRKQKKHQLENFDIDQFGLRRVSDLYLEIYRSTI